MTALIVVRRDESPLVEWRSGVRTRLHVAAGTEPESLCVFEQWCEPGCGAPTHTHLETEELITVVAGTAEVWVEDERATLAAGDSVLVRPHSWHGFHNNGDTELHIIAALAAAQPLVRYRDEHEQRELRGGGATDSMIDARRAIRES